MYKGERFEIRPVEEVKGDILALRALTEEIKAWAHQAGYPVEAAARYNGILWMEGGEVRSVFLGDSNSLVIKTPQLVEIIYFLYEAFPALERVTSYARAHTLLRKSPEELEEIRAAGLNRLHVGLETGDDQLLQEIQKGATAEEMIQAGRKAVEAGFELSEYVMPGLGGQERWRGHATGTARVLNAIGPRFIRLRTLGLAPETPLFERCQRGEFTPPSLEGLLLEVRLLVQGLEVASELVASDFSPNFYLAGVDGYLPQDKERILWAIDYTLERVRSRRGEAHSPQGTVYP
jgi:radical SAM superfamily enzyme YgiQ (UPF0313 family)